MVKRIEKAILKVIYNYAWLAVISLPFLSAACSKPMKVSDLIHSEKRIKKFQYNEIPFYFLHDTDVHLSHDKPSRAEKFTKSLEIAKSLGIKNVIISGDLIDNLNKTTEYQECYPRPEDQAVYSEVMQKYNSTFNILDVSGNHDHFETLEFSSPNEYFTKYSNLYSKLNPNYKNFQIHTEMIGDTAFILLNPFEFPTVHCVLDFWGRPDTDFLDRLENEISLLLEKTEHIILVNHFPAHLWRNVKSSKNLNFMQILAKYDIELALSGHSHPKTPVYTHHGENLEIVGSDLGDHGKMNIVFRDNGEITYHSFSVDHPPPLYITYPPSMEQITARSVFNEDNPFLKVFSTKKEPIYVEGNFSGKLELLEETEFGYLYGVQMNFDTSENQQKTIIVKQSDYSVNHTIFIGEKLPRRHETVANFSDQFGPARISFVILVPLMLFITMPFDIFMYGDKKFPAVLFFGFTNIRQRYCKLAKWKRIGLFILALLPLVCPSVIIPVEGKYGFLNLYGYCVNGKWVYDFWGQIVCGIFEGLVTFPAVLAAISLNFREGFEMIVFTVGILYVGNWGCNLVSRKYMGQMSTYWLGTHNIFFYFIPRILVLLYIVVFVIEKPRKLISKRKAAKSKSK